MVHYNAAGRRGWLDISEVQSEIEFFAGDIVDPDSVAAAVRGQEYIFHLAALIAIPYSYEAPAAYVRTNINGTLNVLQAARRYACERVLHTSTSEVYGTAITVPICERHPLQGQSPYSASKIGADKLAESFHRSFNAPVVTVRPFNTFGPRQSARAVIPTIISQCLAGCETIRLGALHPTRDMNFVTNTVEGFLAAAEATDAIGQVINFGSGREISIGELARTIAKQAGVSVEIDCDDRRLRPEKSEVARLLADNSLARELSGWTPRVSLEDGLRKTIEWFRSNLKHYREHLYNI
jgi:NAD dependent epimerase/dehydratase